MAWWNRRKVDERSASISVSDPVLAAYFGVGGPVYAGVSVTETTALGFSPVWRAVSLISSVTASLGSSAVRTLDDGTKAPIRSWLDDPAGQMRGLVDQTPFEFWETLSVHLLLHGNAFGIHMRNGAGGLWGLQLVHPNSVAVEVDVSTGRKSFQVQMTGRKVERFTPATMLHIPAMSTDGIMGLSPITVARQSLGIGIAGDRSAANMFGNGPLHAGMVTPEDDDMDPDEAVTIKEALDQKMTGWENAGQLAVVNRRLKFTPWTMSMADAQFLESRAFQVEEVARWFGIPPFALMQTEKQTSWGTGIEAQQRGLSRQVLGPFTNRIEARTGTLLPPSVDHAFDFHDLEKPTPEEEVALLVAMVNGGLITVDEARARLNMAPRPEEEEDSPVEDPSRDQIEEDVTA